MHDEKNSIPISPSLGMEGNPRQDRDKKRLVFISAIAISIALIVSVIAKLLVYLINIITNISFHHRLSANEGSPATNEYGLLVIIIPAIGGIIVGLMAFYGSKAIRGHGHPGSDGADTDQ